MENNPNSSINPKSPQILPSHYGEELGVRPSSLKTKNSTLNTKNSSWRGVGGEAAPVLIFAYNRPAHFSRLIDSLKQCDGIENHNIYIFIDGPKTHSDIPKIQEVKSIANYFLSYHNSLPLRGGSGRGREVREGLQNKGLAQSVISGVTEIINKYGKAIILEDDLILHPQFLNYMDQGLDKFMEDKRILSICGYGLKIRKPKDYKGDIYLARRSSSWGWGTWADRWNEVDWEVKDFEELKNSRKLQRRFKLGGSDMYGMLKGYMEGKNNSWAIRFCYHQFKKEMYSIHPFKSLVQNEGYGEEASNCQQRYSRFRIELPKKGETFSFKTSNPLEFNNKFDIQLRNYHSLPIRIYSRIRKIINI